MSVETEQIATATTTTTVSPVLTSAAAPIMAADYVPLTHRPTLASFVGSSNENQLQRLHSFLEQLGRKSDGRDWVLPTRKAKPKSSKRRSSSKRSKKDKKDKKDNGDDNDNASNDSTTTAAAAVQYAGNRSKSFSVSALNDLTPDADQLRALANHAQEAPEPSRKSKKKSSKRKHKKDSKSDEKRSSKKKRTSSSSSSSSKKSKAAAAQSQPAEPAPPSRRASICGPPPTYNALQTAVAAAAAVPAEAAYIPIRQSFDATNLRMRGGMMPMAHQSPMNWAALTPQPHQQVHARSIDLGYIGDHSGTTLANLAAPVSPVLMGPPPRRMSMVAQPVAAPLQPAVTVYQPALAMPANCTPLELSGEQPCAEAEAALGMWNDWETFSIPTELFANVGPLDAGNELEGNDASRRSSLEYFEEKQEQEKQQQLQLQQQELLDQACLGLLPPELTNVPVDSSALDAEYSKLWDAFCGDDESIFNSNAASAALSMSTPSAACLDLDSQDPLFRSVSFCL